MVEKILGDVWLEIVKWADPFLLAGVVGLTWWVKPFFDDLLPGRKLALVPLVLGLTLAWLVEYSTPEFDLNMLIRRTLAYGVAAPGAYTLSIEFGPLVWAGIRRKIRAALVVIFGEIDPPDVPPAPPVLPPAA